MKGRAIQRRTTSQKGRKFEVELITGLERLVNDELAETLGRREYRLTGYPREGRISIRYSGRVARMLKFRSVIAVHRVERFEAPRPKALLGHEHFRRLLGAIREIIGFHPAGTFKTFRVSAAGAESTTMRRIRSEIGTALRLDEETDKAHLNLSIRRSTSGAGWEVLIRLTPMPLSARTWRVCNRPDALNATVAHVMAKLPGHSKDDRFLNLGCGSGTLLAERLAVGPAGSIVGLDNDPEALTCSERNLAAAGVLQGVTLIRGDIHSPPLPDNSCDTVTADLPFGMLANTDDGLDELYDAALRETARLVVQGGAFTVITARRRLFENTLSRHSEQWCRTAEIPLRVSFHSGYIAPSIYLLRRV